MGISVIWIVIAWIIIPLVVGLVAKSRGRSFIGWFLYTLLIWPVALVHLLLIGRTERGWERKAQVEGRARCPHCAEFIQRQARVCPHCRKDVRESPAAAADGRPGKVHRGLPGYPARETRPGQPLIHCQSGVRLERPYRGRRRPARASMHWSPLGGSS